MSTARSLLLVNAIVLATMLIGMANNVLIANFFGLTRLLDSYYAALVIPELYSPDQADAQRLLQVNRGHGRIEDSCHFILDWNDDEACPELVEGTAPRCVPAEPFFICVHAWLPDGG